jgi:hypothetical protein
VTPPAPTPVTKVPLPVTRASVDAPLPSTSEIGSQSMAVPGTTLLTSAMLRNHGMPPALSERADINQRVAAFKARQSQIGREREAYYDATQASIRTQLGNDSSRDRL